MPEPTQPKPQPYQIVLNGCAIGCFSMVLAMAVLLAILILGATLSPPTKPQTTEVPNGH